MKKLLYMILFMFVTAGLVACDEPEDDDPVDTTPPIFFGINDKVINVGDAFDPLDGVTAIDDTDGDITASIEVSGTYDVDTAGIYDLTYTVSDAAGNDAEDSMQLIVRVLPESPLFITNGDFSEPLDGTWTHWSGEGGSSTVTIVDGVLNYDITAAGNQWWSSQFSQPNLTLPQGALYKLVFEARADIARGLVVKLENPQYFGYIDEAVQLTTEWQTFEIEVFFPDPTIENGKLIFGGGTTMGYNGETGALTTIQIDNVAFVELELEEDTTPPVLSGIGAKTIGLGEGFDPLLGVTVTDDQDVDLTIDDITVTGTVDNQTPGDYTLTYEVTDASGNKAEETRVITVIEGLVPSTWLVENGDFEIDQSVPYPQPAEEGWGWHGAGTFTIDITGGMAVIDVSNLGTVPHGVQFYQQNRVIEQGRYYRITFDARADIARPIMVALEEGVSRRFDQIVDLSTTWETYTIEFQHLLPGYANGKFAFFMGLVGSDSVPTTIYLDNVSVETIGSITDEEGPVIRGASDYILMQGVQFDPLAGISVTDAHDDELTIDDVVVDSTVDTSVVGDYTVTYTVTDASSNETVVVRNIHVKAPEDMLASTFYVTNGDMSTDQDTPYAQPAVDGWGWHGNGTFTVTIAEGIMTQVITNVGTVFYGTQFYQQNRVIETEAMYRISFDAKVDLERSIRMTLEMGTAIQFSQDFDLTTDWESYELLAKIPAYGFSNGKFAFFAGKLSEDSPPTTFYLDNISIELVGYLVDTEAPIIIGAGDSEAIAGLEFDPLLGVSVFDLVDKSLTAADITVTGTVDIFEPGTYDLLYSVTDRQGNTTELTRIITVVDSGEGLPSTFKVTNGDFETEQLTPYAQPAVDGWGWHGSGKFNVAITDGVASIDVFDTWTLFYGIQFYQQNRELREGHIYQITFKARADVPRPLRLSLEPGASGFNAYFDLTTEWQTFTYEHEHTAATITNGKFAFFLGEIHGSSTPTTVHLDDVMITRIETLSDDTEAPQIWNVEDAVVVQGNPFDPVAGMKVYDHIDKDLTVEDVAVTGTVDTATVGAYTLTYTLTDANANTLEKTRTVNVIAAEDAVTSRVVFTDPDWLLQSAITNQDANVGWTLKGSGSGSASHTFTPDGIQVDITNIGTVPHGVQFFQRTGFIAENGNVYKLSFMAKSDAERDIKVIMERIANWGYATADSHTITITTDWVQYDVYLHQTLENSNDVKIGFFMGLVDSVERSALTSVYFKDLTLDLVGYTVDLNAPRLDAPDITVEQGAVFDPLAGIKVGDTAKSPSIVITSVTEGFITDGEAGYVVDTSTLGTFVLTYTVTDHYGNTLVHDRTVTIVEPATE